MKDTDDIIKRAQQADKEVQDRIDNYCIKLQVDVKMCVSQIDYLNNRSIFPSGYISLENDLENLKNITQTYLDKIRNKPKS